MNDSWPGFRRMACSRRGRRAQRGRARCRLLGSRHGRGSRSGRVRRVRRSWLVSTDCDPRRAAAASVGGRVTCVSGAALHGLWVPRRDDMHIAVRPNAARFESAGVKIHWATGPSPVRRRAVDDPLINVLFHVARCLPRRDALAVWESALQRGVVDREVLRLVAWRSTRARELASLATVLSDSGLESVFIDGLRHMGLPVRQQVWIDGHRVDVLVGDRLVIQLDGFAHHQASDRRRDIRADARLTLRGYTVLRFDSSRCSSTGTTSKRRCSRRSRRDVTASLAAASGDAPESGRTAARSS